MKAMYYQVSWNCSILVNSSSITCIFPQILPRMGISSSNHLGIDNQSDDVFIASAALLIRRNLRDFLNLHVLFTFVVCWNLFCFLTGY